MYQEPRKYFSDTKTQMSQNYFYHCIVELKSLCPYLHEDSIITALRDHNDHLLPAYKELELAYCSQERILLERIQNHIRPVVDNIQQVLVVGQDITNLMNDHLRHYKKSKQKLKSYSKKKIS